MALVAFDPPLFVDELFDLMAAPAYEAVQATGLQELSKIEVYRMVLDNIEDASTLFGYFVNENKVLMASDEVIGYLDKLRQDIYGELVSRGLDDDDALGVVTGVEGMEDDIQDESQDFQQYVEENFDPEIILDDILTDAFECAIIVMTGDKEDIKRGQLTL